MEDGAREQFCKLSDVVVRNVVMKMLAVFCPRSSPEFFHVTCTYRFRSTCASCAYLHTLSLVILTYALLILQLKTNTKHKYF